MLSLHLHLKIFSLDKTNTSQTSELSLLKSGLQRECSLYNPSEFHLGHFDFCFWDVFSAPSLSYLSLSIWLSSNIQCSTIRINSWLGFCQELDRCSCRRPKKKRLPQKFTDVLLIDFHWLQNQTKSLGHTKTSCALYSSQLYWTFWIFLALKTWLMLARCFLFLTGPETLKRPFRASVPISSRN